MRINLSRMCVFLVAIVVVIPTYYFLSGIKIHNIIYYLNTMALLLVICGTKSQKKDYGISVVYFISLLVFVIISALDVSLSRAFNVFVSSFLVVYAATRCVTNEEAFVSAIDCLLFCSVPLLLSGLVEELFRFNFFQILPLVLPGSVFHDEIRLGLYRVSATFGHPIVYCNYLAMVAALALYRISCTLPKKKKRVFAAIYVLILINSVFTVSRSIWLVLIAEQVVLLYFKGEKWFTPKKTVVVSFIILAVLLADFLGIGIFDAAGDMINMLLQIFGLGSSDYSSNFSSMGYTGIFGDRIDLYSWVAKVISGNPWFGEGTDAVFSYMATEYREKTSIENYYLRVLFHNGIVGLSVTIIGLLSLLHYIISRMLKQGKNNLALHIENKLTFNKTMLVVFVGCLLSWFMVDQSDEVYTFYVLIGLLICYNTLLFKNSKAVCQ